LRGVGYATNEECMSPMIGRRRSIHFKAGLVGWKSDGPLIDAILRK